MRLTMFSYRELSSAEHGGKSSRLLRARGLVKAWKSVEILANFFAPKPVAPSLVEDAAQRARSDSEAAFLNSGVQ
jgi:hypothetical protein